MVGADPAGDPASIRDAPTDSLPDDWRPPRELVLEHLVPVLLS